MISRHHKDIFFKRTAQVTTFLCLGVLALLLYHIGREGMSYVSLDFLSNFPSRFPEKSGIKAALWGSFWLILLTGIFAIPIGIATAVYLEEFAPKNRLMTLIELNINNLAGTPSIVFGFLGLVLFVRGLGFERSLISGAATLSLLVLPMIIIAAREAIKGVPRTLREAAFALGVTRWQCTIGQVIPTALPGIMTGIILALSRAMGETAPIIMIGALTYVAFTPEGPLDEFTTLPIQIYNWASRPQEEFHQVSAAGIIVLLLMLFTLNFAALLIRMRTEKKVKL